MNQLSQSQVEAIRKLGDALVEAVELAGSQGAPASILYLAVMTVGISYDSFQNMMDALVAAGRVRRGPHHLYYRGN